MSLQMAGELRRVNMPIVRAAVEITPNSYDEKTNTIDMIWTTGATVRRSSWDGDYDEELVVTPESVRLGRLNAGAPLLNAHSSYDISDVIGAVVPGSARIDNGRGLAKVKLTRRQDPVAAGAVQDIKDGVLRNISVGYVYHRVEKIEGDDQAVPLWRVTDWEPMEVSSVPIPADAGAQIRAEATLENGKKPEPTILRTYPCELVAVTLDRVALAAMRMRMHAREARL